MWWPFRKKYTIAESGLLSGLTDWHSHLLPGVDDGLKTIEDTDAVLGAFAEHGVATVWLTPHIMEDVPNTTADLRERFNRLQQHYKGTISLHLGAENMLDNLFERRFAEKDFLPLGRYEDHLLVETSYFTPPSDLNDKLRRTISAGYYPVLAHPERYVYMSERHYRNILDMGVRFQLNLYALTGMYGETAAHKASDLLKRGVYSFIGTDTHRLSQFQKAIAVKALTSAQISAIEKIK